jgi:hypothetical protein
MELDSVAQECGWFGYSEGPGQGSFLIYRCAHPDHLTAYIANDADDPEYYEIQCARIRQCQT